MQSRGLWAFTLADLWGAMTLAAVSIALFVLGVRSGMTAVVLAGAGLFAIATSIPFHRLGVPAGQSVSLYRRGVFLVMSLVVAAKLYLLLFFFSTLILFAELSTTNQWFYPYHVVFRPLVRAFPSVVAGSAKESGLSDLEVYFVVQALKAEPARQTMSWQQID